MTKERIRILVDTSRDTGWSEGLVKLEPDSIYQTTDNRDYLSEAVLKNYGISRFGHEKILKLDIYWKHPPINFAKIFSSR